MDKERWLEINTFVCPHGLGRISPEQCEANRKRPRITDRCFTDPNRPLMPGPCETCTEWKELCEQVYKRREQHKKEEKKVAKSRMIICANCGKEAPNYGRGLCAKCYRKLRKEGKLPPRKKKAKAEKKKVDYHILLDFEVAPDLLEEIKRRADEELRSVEMQILWELKKAVKIGGHCDWQNPSALQACQSGQQ